MSTTTNTRPLSFQLGEPRSYASLTLVPLFPRKPPVTGFIGLDEAFAHGLTLSEVGSEGLVELLALENTLGERVLLYEGEELVGAKQNRIVEQTILVEAHSTLKISAKCVERGRWARSSRYFTPASRAAYPSLRKVKREGQLAVWTEVAAKQRRLEVHSPTEAAEALYVSRGSSLDEYLQALPRSDGQAGALVGIGGKIVCLDYVSRPDVFAGLYLKLLRGYALDAIESPLERRLSGRDLGRFLGELELAERTRRLAPGLGEQRELSGYALGQELVLNGELLAMSVFANR